MGYIGEDEELQEIDLQPIPEDVPAPAEPSPQAPIPVPVP